MTRFKPLLVLFLLLFQTSCAQNIVASIIADAEVTSNTGVTVTRAQVNFTSFSQPQEEGDNDTRLRMRFRNPEGDQLDIVLSRQPGGSFSAGDYTLDGNNNLLESSFTVTVDGDKQVITTRTEDGTLTATAINLDGNSVIVFQGSFQAYIAGTSGLMNGTISVNTAP